MLIEITDDNKNCKVSDIIDNSLESGFVLGNLDEVHLPDRRCDVFIRSK
jgi:hypothetical protein